MNKKAIMNQIPNRRITAGMLAITHLIINHTIVRIPRHSGHSFHAKAASDSTPFRPLIP